MKEWQLATRLCRILLLSLICVSILSPQNTAIAKVTVGSVENENIQDVIKLPQDPFYYLNMDYDDRLISKEDQEDYLEEFKKLYFSPWNRNRLWNGMSTQNWIYSFFSSARGYGENLRQRPSEWLDKLKNRANLKKLGTLNKKAITVRESDMRLLPTSEPFFYSPDLPGEGYPFDYIQNSGIHAGEPIFVSHLSKDGAWAWCETSYAAGWIRIDDLAFVSEDFIDEWTALPMGVITMDNFSVTEKEQGFKFTAKTGTLFPIFEKHIKSNKIIIPIRDSNGTAKKATVSIAADRLKPHPLPMTGLNAAMICGSIMDTPYGWGGSLGNRDCSSTMRDIFIPFGIWLPRNSAAQAKSGIRIDLQNLSNDEKITAILREAKPFTTLIYRNGHIMLYIGSRRSNPVILHNMWGIKTLEGDKEGRKIVGKTVITSLEPGKELKNLHPEGGLLLDTVTGITLLGGIK